MRMPGFFRRRFRRVVLALFALTLAFVLANCDAGTPEGTGEAPPAEEAAAPTDTGTLVFGSGGQMLRLMIRDIPVSEGYIALHEDLSHSRSLVSVEKARDRWPEAD
ncbi:MAG: hypothetical protein F6K42_29165, partial [Leptolyngbya sp. SIO1D8]|nr:hypothetical protein [Leptolyngbya sp. SIO1D8]